MSDDNKGGNSDLDIFEGLGKKSTPKTSAVPPPPPGSTSQVAAKPQPGEGLKKTLVGVAPNPMFPPISDAAIPAPPRSVPPPLPASAQAPSGSSVSAPPAPPPPPATPSGSMRAVTQPSAVAADRVSKPPPPPGRGSLPNMPSSPSQSGMPAVSASPSTSPSATQKVGSQSAPPAASTRPSPAASQVPPAPSTEPQVGQKAKANGGKLDMDWDDDDEATHVFDKDSKENQQVAAAAGPEGREPERASMDMIMSNPRPSQIPKQGPAAGTPPPAPAATATLSGAFGALGQPRESTNGSAAPPSLRGGPAASQSLRSAPPPPPPSMSNPPAPPPASLRQPNPSTSTAPIPPPPPPGQTTTAPMHMPMRQPSMPPQPPPASMPPQQVQQHHSASMPASMPPHQVSQPPMPQMPPVSRAMEATAMVPRPQQSKAGLWVALLIGVMAAVGAAVFFLMPRSGSLTVNVADAKGGTVKGLEIQVDGKKCESAPCVMSNLPSGAHVVSVTAPGYESLAPKAITVESGKTASVDFTLQPGKAGAGGAGGTGIKVAGSQTGVKLSVDGKEYGTLPQEIHDLSPGEHKVKISGSERFAPVEKTITVGADEMVDLGNIQLKVLKGKVTITLGTPGAKVFLVSGTNRKEVPQFPIAIDFDPNEKWQLEAKLFGHDDFVQPITFDDGQAEKTITVTLTPKGSAPPPSTAAAPVAHPPTTPPVGAPPVAAPPKEPKAPAEPPVAATPKEPKSTNPPPAAGGEAFLNINSLPASTVVLDGKPLGATPRLHVSVSPGSHTVLFVNAEQSLKKSITVTVGAGETKAAFAKLRD